jgi:hypothetical protein
MPRTKLPRTKLRTSMHVALAASVLMTATILAAGTTPTAQAANPGFAVFTPDPVTPGVDYPIVVMATTIDGTLKQGYSGTVTFSTNAAGASALPGSYTFNGRDEGIHVFQDALDVATAQTGVTVTVTDADDPALSGTSATFAVQTRPGWPTIVQSTTAVGTSTTPTATLRSAPIEGNLEVAFISSAYGIPSLTGEILSGWTTIRATNDLAAVYRVVPAGASATVAADPFKSRRHWTMNVNEYRGVYTRSPIAGAGMVADRGTTSGIGSANVMVHPASLFSRLGGSDVRFLVALYERNGSVPGHDGTPTQAHVTSDRYPGDAMGACTGADLGFPSWTRRSHHPAPRGTRDNLLTTFEHASTCPVPGFTSVRTGWNWPDENGRPIAPNHSTVTIVLALRGIG